MRKNGQPPFKEQILKASTSNGTRVVLAVDFHNGDPQYVEQQTIDLVKETLDSICCVKLGRQTILTTGPRAGLELNEKIHDLGLPIIIDDKLNDIDNTNEAITQTYLDLRFDAITVNPFAGWEGGLQPVFKLAHQNRMGVIPLVYMSHPGAAEGYGQRVLQTGSNTAKPQYEIFAQKALKWEADGVVVGATRPEIIRKTREILGHKVLIFSPGVGTQGGDIKRALDAGTDYLIIGRSITEAKDPGKAAMEFASASRKRDF